MDSRETRRSTAARAQRAVIADASAGTVTPLPATCTHLPGMEVSDLVVSWNHGLLGGLPAGHAWDVVRLPPTGAELTIVADLHEAYEAVTDARSSRT